MVLFFGINQRCWPSASMDLIENRSFAEIVAIKADSTLGRPSEKITIIKFRRKSVVSPNDKTISHKL
ncbi:hypothetical protein ACTXT7_013167 [Hymenolepis weldensis]